MIQIQQLHKSFGKIAVLQGIDLQLDQSGITAILGPNGSGKTTLVKSILGMVNPSVGSITFNQQTVHRDFSYRTHISYLPQIARFPENLSMEELIHMIRDLRPGKTNEGYFIDLFDLAPELKKKMSTLSGGTRQKVNLLLTCMYDSQVLILDEPTTGLDPLAMIHLKEHLVKEKQKGKQIIITTHIMSFVEELADHIIFILEGKVYFNGKTEELMQKYDGGSVEAAIANILRKNQIKA